MNKNLKNALLVFLAGSSYGFIVPVVKVASDANIFPSTFLPVQYLIAFVVCLVGVLATKTKLTTFKSALPLALLGLCTGATSMCYYTAVTLLPPAVALTLLFQYVWIDVIIDSIHKRKLPSKVNVIAVLIVLAGSFMATGLFDGSFQSLDLVGVVFGAASALFYALFLFLSGIVGTDKPLFLRTMMLSFGGFIITIICTPNAFTTVASDLGALPFALVLSVIGILLPTSLINYASPKLDASMVSIMASSELPVGVLSAWLFLGDTPSVLVLIGTVLVLAGIVVNQLPALHGRLKRSS